MLVVAMVAVLALLALAGCDMLLGLNGLAPVGGGDAGPCGAGCSGATPICDLATKSCVGCLTNSDCGDGGTTACIAEYHLCAECVSNADCTTSGLAFCSVTTHLCGACASDTDCVFGSTCTLSSSGRNVCEVSCNVASDCPGYVAPGAADAGDASANAVVVQCCSGGCVTTSSDEYNCGTCGNNCTLKSGNACCNSLCVNTTADPNNCGACGKACSHNQTFATCTAGSCGCPSNYTLNPTSNRCQRTFLVGDQNIILDPVTNSASSFPLTCTADGGSTAASTADAGNYPYFNFNATLGIVAAANTFGFQWLDTAGPDGFVNGPSAFEVSFVSGVNCFNPVYYQNWRSALNTSAAPNKYSDTCGEFGAVFTCTCPPVSATYDYSYTAITSGNGCLTSQSYPIDGVHYSQYTIQNYTQAGVPDAGGPVFLPPGPGGLGLSRNLDTSSNWYNYFARVIVTY